eukprot:762760-Hanusia_phi.AAC.6
MLRVSPRIPLLTAHPPAHALSGNISLLTQVEEFSHFFSLLLLFFSLLSREFLFLDLSLYSFLSRILPLPLPLPLPSIRALVAEYRAQGTSWSAISGAAEILPLDT